MVYGIWYISERAKFQDYLIINLDFVEGRNCVSAAYFWASYTCLMAAILQSHTLCQMMIAAHTPNLWPKNRRGGTPCTLRYFAQTLFNLFLPTQVLMHLISYSWSAMWKYKCEWMNNVIGDGGSTTYFRKLLISGVESIYLRAVLITKVYTITQANIIQQNICWLRITL